MHKDLYRQFIWHLRYVESLLDATLDVDVDEENLKALAFHTSQLEKVLADALSTRGKQCVCPVCGKKFHTYLPVGEIPHKNALCPNCYSHERHRALWIILNMLKVERRGMKILHFGPEPIFYQRFSSIPDVEYWPVDLNPRAFGVRKVVDITNIPFEDNTFDMIMASAVLEHIPDDKKAMSELYRVLKPNTGVAFLQVPIDTTRFITLEKPEYNTPELRSKYYGQEDHVRFYGLDYPEKLRDANFFVEEIAMGNIFDDDDIEKFGLFKNVKYPVCRKLIYG